MNKIILIGIDAAAWKVIDPLIEKGELPTISKLIKEGARASLQSLPGYKSPALWNCIATGKYPEKNGILYFTNLYLNLSRLKIKKNITTAFLINWPYRLGKLFSNNKKDPSKMTKNLNKIYIYYMLKLGKIFEKLSIGGNYLITSNSRKEKAIWEMLSEENVTCGVIGWLVTWPAKKINGYLVSQKAVEGINKLEKTKDIDLEKGDISYPKDFINQIKELNRHPPSISKEEIKQFFNNLDQNDENEIRGKRFNKKNRLNLFSYMFISDIFSTEVSKVIKEKGKPEFLSLYLPGLDGIQHVFWQYHEQEKFNFVNIKKEEVQKFKDTIKNYYKFLDTQIKSLIDEESTIIIISDHGVEAIKEKNYDHKGIRSGQHDESPDGILILSGPNIKRGISLKKAHILDIAPTILHLMNKPIDSNMDGTVLEEAFTEEFTKNNHIKKKNYGKREEFNSNVQYSKDEEEKVKERLEALGYLD